MLKSIFYGRIRIVYEVAWALLIVGLCIYWITVANIKNHLGKNNNLGFKRLKDDINSFRSILPPRALWILLLGRVLIISGMVLLLLAALFRYT